MRSQLVDRARSGDHEAFRSLVAEFADRCYALAYRILRDPDRAQDATQQALLGAWRDLPSLRDPDRIEAWLYRLVVNASYIEARSERAGSPGCEPFPSVAHSGQSSRLPVHTATSEPPR